VGCLELSLQTASQTKGRRRHNKHESINGLALLDLPRSKRVSSQQFIQAQGRGFDPRDYYTESLHEHGPESPLVVSPGLLQLSFPGDRAAYHGEIPDAEALYDRSVNLGCGIKILAQFVTRDQRIAGQVDPTGKAVPCIGRSHAHRAVRTVRTA
jgi:hypothetical protein